MKADRTSENLVMEFVRSGDITIDEQGRCWRDDPPRRAESRMPNGYLKLFVQRDKQRGIAYAHRIVYRHFHGDIPPGLTINHKGADGDKGNNHPDNLELATYAEQIRHAKAVLGAKYRDVRGQGNHMAKLSPEQVKEIRQRRSLGEKLREIASDFGIVMQTVSRIARGDRWPERN